MSVADYCSATALSLSTTRKALSLAFTQPACSLRRKTSASASSASVARRQFGEGRSGVAKGSSKSWTAKLAIGSEMGMEEKGCGQRVSYRTRRDRASWTHLEWARIRTEDETFATLDDGRAAGREEYEAIH